MSRAKTLCTAAIEGDRDRVVELLAGGGDPNSFLKEMGWSALSCALKGRSAAIARTLLERGGDPNRPNRDGHGTLPLMDLAVWPATEALYLLVDHGADPNGRDRWGRTVLMHYALFGRSVELVQALVDRGADAHAVDPFGVNALAFANRARRYEIETHLERLGVEERGAENFELLQAVHREDLRSVEIALARGANPDFWEPGDENVLYWAAVGRQVAILRVLLKAGADPNALAAEGHSALYAAVGSGTPEAVRLLVENGASAGPNDEVEHTLVEVAADRGFAEVVRLLGGDPARIGIAFARGIGSFDVTEVALLVRADCEKAAEAFAAARGLALEKSIRGQSIRVTTPSFLAYQLVGHAWSAVEALCCDEAEELKPDDARFLSRDLDAKAMFVAISDTAGSVEYATFEKGDEVERVTYRDDQDLCVALPVSDLELSRLRDPFRLVNLLVTRQDAYLPGWSEGARRAKAGSRVRLRPFKRSECPSLHLAHS